MLTIIFIIIISINFTGALFSLYSFLTDKIDNVKISGILRILFPIVDMIFLTALVFVLFIFESKILPKETSIEKYNLAPFNHEDYVITTPDNHSDNYICQYKVKDKNGEEKLFRVSADEVVMKRGNYIPTIKIYKKEYKKKWYFLFSLKTLEENTDVHIELLLPDSGE